jgi:hypothetical protein|tara:strand:- start:100 stop:312 length:213 start_codon:yes stop_codon:yes gene_type:complete
MFIKLSELFFEHLTNWGLVWFGVVFWGSIFNAMMIYILDTPGNILLSMLPYFFGFLLGLMGKYKGWSWIN